MPQLEIYAPSTVSGNAVDKCAEVAFLQTFGMGLMSHGCLRHSTNFWSETELKFPPLKEAVKREGEK